MARLKFGAFLAPHHPIGEHPMLQFRRDLEALAAENAGFDAVVTSIDLIAVLEVDAPILHLLIIETPAEHQVFVPGPDTGRHHAICLGGPRFMRG